jgi:DNA-binding response OmpR family regulator
VSDPATDAPTDEPVDVDAPAAGDAAAAPPGRTTVVVASTDDTVCEVLARIVERSGHEVVRVTDADQASGAVLSASADAVVLDLGAANVDALRALRSGGSQRGVDARAVVISTGPANALLAWQVDADAVLTRPFAAEALEQVLADALARSDDERRSLRDQQLATLS